MKINAEFDKRAVVHSESMDWVTSPIAGVDRRSLDRVGGEVARATTIVRYAPGSEFSPHVHTGGEEFLVLDGVFQDEHGDFPAGSYIRNPPQSSHKPGSDLGCVIFVKLWQFDLQDRTHVRLRTDSMFDVSDRNNPGVSVIPLFSNVDEEVSIQQWEPGTEVNIDVSGGAEILVLSGRVTQEGDELVRHSWLRLPKDTVPAMAVAGGDGAKVWIKKGHLNQIDRDLNNLAQR